MQSNNSLTKLANSRFLFLIHSLAGSIIVWKCLPWVAVNYNGSDWKPIRRIGLKHFPSWIDRTNKQTTPTLFKHFLGGTIKLDQGDKGSMQGWPPLRSATSLNLQKKLSLCSLIIRLWCLQFCPHAVHQTLDSFILSCFWFGRNLWLSPTRKHKEHQLPWTLALGSKCPKGSQCDINRARS